MLQTTVVLVVTVTLLHIQTVYSSCGYYGMPGVNLGDPPITTCNYHGWEISINSSFYSPAPYCEHCTCEEGGGMSCCGYGWRGGHTGIPGCVRIIDFSTCDELFYDENDRSTPCPRISRIPAFKNI